MSWGELLCAALTVGRRNWEAVRSAGIYSYYECFYRALMVNLDSWGPSLIQPAAYKTHDGSKVGVRQFWGRQLAARCSSQLLLPLPEKLSARHVLA